MTKTDAGWNCALIALGRKWRANMLHYAPEELHEINKAIWALWRGPKEDSHPDIGAMIDPKAIDCACGEWTNVNGDRQFEHMDKRRRLHTPARCAEAP